jgi:hypothetical protein
MDTGDLVDGSLVSKGPKVCYIDQVLSEGIDRGTALLIDFEKPHHFCLLAGTTWNLSLHYSSSMEHLFGVEWHLPAALGLRLRNRHSKKSRGSTLSISTLSHRRRQQCSNTRPIVDGGM